MGALRATKSIQKTRVVLRFKPGPGAEGDGRNTAATLFFSCPLHCFSAKHRIRNRQERWLTSGFA